MPHIIRLHSVWSRVLPGSEDSRRVHLPDQLHPCESSQGIHYTRSFNRPTGIDDTGIDDGQRVMLVVHHWVGNLTASLDEAPLVKSMGGHNAPLRIDITHGLSGSHRLSFHIEPETDEKVGLDGIVTLEID